MRSFHSFNSRLERERSAIGRRTELFPLLVEDRTLIHSNEKAIALARDEMPSESRATERASTPPSLRRDSGTTSVRQVGLKR